MPLSLQNHFLRVVVHPKEGGRIASIHQNLSGTEFLLQAQGERIRLMPGLLARFEDGPCAGIEECLPTVGPCDHETNGGPVPDHGDFWQIPWTVVGDTSPTHVRLHATGFSRPLHFEKSILLRDRSLSITYTVTNQGTRPQSFLYACHPLLAVDAGDVIVLPDEVKSLRLHSSRNLRLGHDGQRIPWPRSSKGDLSQILAADSGVAEMLYTDRLKNGYCGLFRARSGEGISLHFELSRLPYVGLWLCYGGWPENGWPKQYALALEPTNAPYGSLKQAQKAGEVSPIAPDESIQWQIRFQMSGPDCSLDDFRESLNR